MNKIFQSKYDKESDSLIIQTTKKEPAISIDWNGAFWIRVNPDTREIVGIEIENISKRLLK